MLVKALRTGFRRCSKDKNFFFLHLAVFFLHTARFLLEIIFSLLEKIFSLLHIARFLLHLFLSADNPPFQAFRLSMKAVTCSALLRVTATRPELTYWSTQP